MRGKRHTRPKRAKRKRPTTRKRKNPLKKIHKKIIKFVEKVKIEAADRRVQKVKSPRRRGFFVPRRHNVKPEKIGIEEIATAAIFGSFAINGIGLSSGGGPGGTGGKVNPTITWSAATVTQGQLLQVTGAGYTPNGPVTFTAPTTSFTQSATADSNGNINFNVTTNVVAPGTYPVFVLDNTSGIKSPTSTVTIVAATAPLLVTVFTSQPTTFPLSSTGFSSFNPVIASVFDALKNPAPDGTTVFWFNTQGTALGNGTDAAGSSVTTNGQTSTGFTFRIKGTFQIYAQLANGTKSNIITVTVQ